MTSKEWMDKYCNIKEETECCANCEHFYRHYTDNRFRPDIFGEFKLMHEGHCGYPRLKTRRLTDVCDHFKRRE